MSFNISVSILFCFCFNNEKGLWGVVVFFTQFLYSLFLLFSFMRCDFGFD